MSFNFVELNAACFVVWYDMNAIDWVVKVVKKLSQSKNLSC